MYVFEADKQERFAVFGVSMGVSQPPTRQQTRSNLPTPAFVHMLTSPRAGQDLQPLVA